MFCSNCGTENKENAKFCRKCGAALGTYDLNGRQPSGSSMREGTDFARKREENSKRLSVREKRIMIVALGVMVVLACITGIVIYSSGQTDAEYDEKIQAADQYMEDMEYDKAETAYLEAIDIEPKQEELGKQYSGAISLSVL